MNKLSFMALGLSLVATAAFADTERANYANQPSKQETTGAVSGIVLGGLAGGPPGAIVGAAVGALLGDGFRTKEEVADLQSNVIALRLESDRLRDEALSLQREHSLAMQELDRLRSVRPQVLPAFLSNQDLDPCCDNTAVSIHFRTGSTTVEPQYEEQLVGLAKIAERMPAANIEITGYADRNGDAAANLRLSRQRTAIVKDFFKERGFESSSISTIAHGETQPLHEQQSFETDFFDRRVIIRLRDTSQQMLTQSQDEQ